MKKLLVAFVLIVNCIRAEENLIEEGFVTFATENYFPLLEVLLESVHAFSDKPIIAYGVNTDVPFSTEKYPRLIKRRLEHISGNVIIQKTRIILESGLRYGVYVEADDIVNKGVDTLFEWCRELHAYPRSPIHPDDQDIQYILDRLGINRKTMHYIHAHVIFSHECMPFIKEWHELCLRHTPYANDEQILNALYWKYGVTEYAPIYDPYYGVYHDYVNSQGLATDRGRYGAYYFMFHGCKSVGEAWHVLRNLKEVHGIE